MARTFKRYLGLLSRTITGAFAAHLDQVKPGAYLCFYFAGSNDVGIRDLQGAFMS